MLTSLQSGVSGINANMTTLSIIGNNIANMNTVGFKAMRASFAEILSQNVGGVIGMQQPGLGVNLSAITPNFTQGAFETTNNPMDWAINGDGLYTLRDAQGALYYSRAGQFSIDKDGYIKNPEGYILRGYLADLAGSITNTIGDLQISRNSIPPNATTNANIVANLDSDSAVTGYVFTVASANIQFDDTSGFAAASLITDGGLVADTAYSGIRVASAIKDALELQNGTADTYTVTYDELTGKFKVANDAGNLNTLTLGWGQGATTVETLLGFDSIDSVVLPTDGSFDTSDVTAGAFMVDKAGETSNFATGMTFYDSLGNDHLVTTYFRKSSALASGNQWNWYSVVDASETLSGVTEVQAQGTLDFTTDGVLNSESTIIFPTGGFDFAGGATQDQTIIFDFGTSLTQSGLGTDGVTQYGQPSAVFDQRQDGYTSGSLKRIYVNNDGTLTGAFTNGRVRAMGQLALADFANTSGLTAMGLNLYVESRDSGAPLYNKPGTSGLGTVQSNALELSTVDLASEFVKLISAQRGFQANSRVISTTDEILVELVNLKR